MPPDQQNRPEFNMQLSAQEFASWYWLKAELVAFCQTSRISPSGHKRAIEARILNFLSGHRIDPKPKLRRSPAPPLPHKALMPSVFRMDMLIGHGWRCGPGLGAFLRHQLGPGFRFNAQVRAFIHTGAGKPLSEVEAIFRESTRPDAPKQAIPEQLEYNRHFRDYFQTHPAATREAAIAAWWTKRNQRKP